MIINKYRSPMVYDAPYDEVNEQKSLSFHLILVVKSILYINVNNENQG
jgi:hypothetical protein